MSSKLDLSNAPDLSDFEIKRFKEIKEMAMDEIIEYYKKLRLYEYVNGVPIDGILFRKVIHPLLLTAIKADRIRSGEKIEVIGDARVKTNRPKIFACTHIGGHDIERVFEGIKTHAYLFLGDPKEAYLDFNRHILNLNGVIQLETDDSLDRHIAYLRAVELLKKHGNLLIFPEGAWNLTDELLVLKLFPGTARMANEAQADIIPVAIEQYDNKFFINIGKNISYDPNKSPNIDLVTEELRDAMAALKLEIFYKHDSIPRSSIPENYREEFLKTIIDRCDYDFSLEEMLDDVYKDKKIILPEEALIVTPKEMYEKRKLLSRGYCNIK